MVEQVGCPFEDGTLFVNFLFLASYSPARRNSGISFMGVFILSLTDGLTAQEVFHAMHENGVGFDTFTEGIRNASAIQHDWYNYKYLSSSNTRLVSVLEACVDVFLFWNRQGR